MRFLPAFLILSALASAADRCVMFEEFTWDG
jgi:hypothetical protein